MPNVKSSIDAHNNRKLKCGNKPTDTKQCNCRDKNNCPLDGKCLESGVIYQATVTSDKKVETYIGLTEKEFKTRHANHKQSFIKENLRSATELSKYIWELKDRKIDYSIKWKIIAHASSYSKISKRCNLCTLEKFYIMFHKDMATLNKKNELVSFCKHRKKFCLYNA